MTERKDEQAGLDETVKPETEKPQKPTKHRGTLGAAAMRTGAAFSNGRKKPKPDGASRIETEKGKAAGGKVEVTIEVRGIVKILTVSAADIELFGSVEALVKSIRDRAELTILRLPANISLEALGPNFLKNQLDLTIKEQPTLLRFAVYRTWAESLGLKPVETVFEFTRGNDSIPSIERRFMHIQEEKFSIKKKVTAFKGSRSGNEYEIEKFDANCMIYLKNLQGSENPLLYKVSTKTKGI